MRTACTRRYSDAEMPGPASGHPLCLPLHCPPVYGLGFIRLCHKYPSHPTSIVPVSFP